MYEELVKRLREEASEWCANCCYRAGNCICAAPDYRKKDCDDYTKLQAADAIEELEKAVPRWIPVAERLPEKDVPVLVCLFGHSPYIAWISHEGEWETDDFIIDSDYLPQVWMPLPVPPKEET